jgi:formylglycine-generating enzyme required for sulfatase activity
MRSRPALAVASIALLAAGCGTTNRYDGHTYQDVLLAARHVMDQYSVANVVGIEEGRVDWVDHDDSVLNQTVSFLTLGSMAHVSDEIEIEVKPVGKRQIDVTVTAGDHYLFAFMPIPIVRGDLEEELQERIRQRLEEMVHAALREEEDRQLRSIGARVDYMTEELALEERRRFGFSQLDDAEIDRFPAPESTRPLGRRIELEPFPRADKPTPADEPTARVASYRDEEPAAEPMPRAHARPGNDPEIEAAPSGPTPEGMVLVPGGIFRMGHANGDADESPEGPVAVGAFFIDRTEISNREYREFIEWLSVSGDHSRCHPEEPAGKSHRPHFWGRTGFDRFNAPDHPVVGIDWFDATSYAAWAGKRLPTEAEWEKAARGTDGRLYPWGETFDPARLNSSSGAGDDLQGTAAVEAYPGGASPYGALSMAGNVSEWCLDTYDEDYYQKRPERNPRNLRPTLGRVLRGGSWKDPRDRIRTSYRNFGRPDRYALYIGFRCARDAR